jgi:allantoinase
MSEKDFVIRGQRVVLPSRVGPASIFIHDGRISRVGEYEEALTELDLIDVQDTSVVMPGLVDTHVHINEPGRTEWEGFTTATRAAAAGGVTTLVDMPLNSIPPTTTLNGLTEKKAAALGQCYVDVGFWGGVVPGNTGELQSMADAGVVGFKCFLVPSGVDEFPHVTEDDLREALPIVAGLNKLLIVHAETPGPIEQATGVTGSSREYLTFLHSRPRRAENEAIELLIRLSSEFHTPVHIVHLSSSDAVPIIRDAQAAGIKITAESCPHYLHFSAEQIPTGATQFKCCPPIREHENREKLWDGLAEGTISIVVSDHSPCPGTMKLQESGDFLSAWGGIASLQLRLPVMWTEASKRDFSLSDLTRWLCSGPADQVGLGKKKGLIAAGYDADIVIWNTEEDFRIDKNTLLHRNKITPYDGELLKGAVQKTFLRGRKIYDGRDVDGPPIGKFV